MSFQGFAHSLVIAQFLWFLVPLFPDHSVIRNLINPRHACAARVTVVVPCVCVSVKSKLTSGTSVRPETSVTYSTGNKGQKMWDFSETAPL